MTTGNFDRLNILLLLFTIFLAFVISANSGFIAGSYSQATERDRLRDRFDVLEAREVRLVDSNGVIRAVLTVHPGKKDDPRFEDKPGLYLYKKDGRSGARFCMDDDRGLLAIDGEKHSCVELSISPLQPESHLEGGYLNLLDSNYKGATLGSWLDLDKKRVGPSSSLKFYEGLGRRIIWEETK